MKLRISVGVAMPGRQEIVEVRLDAGATIADVLASAKVRERFPELRGDEPVGIWSRVCSRETRVRDGDRVEVYRALRADPKAQRRARARAKTASPRSRNVP